MYGAFVEIGYDILRLLSDTDQQFFVFGRLEKLDTQFRVPSGYSRNPANSQLLATLGFQYFPIINIAVKADFQLAQNDAKTGVNAFQAGIGYIF